MLHWKSKEELGSGGSQGIQDPALPQGQLGHTPILHLALGDSGRGLPTPSISGSRGARQSRPGLPGGCVKLGAGQGRSLASRRWEPTGGEQAPIHPRTEGPFRAPPGAASSPAGRCSGQKGGIVEETRAPLLRDLCLGARGQVEAGGERSSASPHPRAPAGQQALGFHPRHGSCRHQQRPQPCPGAGPDPFATQTRLRATPGA